MKQRVAEYIADFLVSHGITDCFTVVGGGAMYLNNALGHKDGLHCTYNHHEQASAIAAEAYGRYAGKPAIVCVTTGPGATNAITGVVCAWQGSVPMIVLSGQVRYATSVYASGLPLRSRGVQEFDIIGSVKNMTKYCELVKEPREIRLCLEKALYEATSGRPGPVWLDIPLDVQASIIETENLVGFEKKLRNNDLDKSVIPRIIEKLKAANKPLILAGNGIRTSGAHSQFIKLIDILKIPVVTTLGSVDAISTENDFFVGKCGSLGDIAGNYAVQECDLLFSIGSRLSFNVTGFDYKNFVPKAYKIISDVDKAELKKDSINSDMKVCCDAKELIQDLLNSISEPLEEKTDWKIELQNKRKEFPLVLDKHYKDRQPNIYVFYESLTKKLPEDATIVVSVGSARTVGSKVSAIKKETRFITNSVTASMGYCLPAAIGVCVARKGKKTILITGEGSLQMNLQELQTLVHNNCDVAVFVLNNGGYHSIRLTQKAYFEGKFVGMGEESNDISFPSLKKIAYAYGIPFQQCKKSEELEEIINFGINHKGLCICELKLSRDYIIEPKRNVKFSTNISGGGTTVE